MIETAENFSLKNYNTFGVSAFAKRFATIDNEQTLKDLLNKKIFSQQPLLVLGGGSNLLFVNNFNGLILHNAIKGIRVLNKTDNGVLVEAGGGESWSDFVDFTVDNGWFGLENLSLIPCTVGAAPVQNIGAYGVEQKEAMYSLTAMHLSTGKIRTFHNAECRFGYRNSFFQEKEEQGKWFILRVTYHLSNRGNLQLDHESLRDYFEGKENVSPKAVSEVIKSIRRSKLPDPAILGNAGSFFKNPETSKETFQVLQQKFPAIPFYKLKNNLFKIPAAWLIEQCGWKGQRIGNVGVHSKQPLVLVNYGNASGQEIFDLSEKVRGSVFQKFGIYLQREVRVID